MRDYPNLFEKIRIRVTSAIANVTNKWETNKIKRRLYLIFEQNIATKLLNLDKKVEIIQEISNISPFIDKKEQVLAKLFDNFCNL